MGTLLEDLDDLWTLLKWVLVAFTLLLSTLLVLCIVGLPFALIALPETFAVHGSLPGNFGVRDLLARGSFFTGATLLAVLACINAELAILLSARQAGGRKKLEAARDTLAAVNLLVGLVAVPTVLFGEVRLFYVVGIVLGYPLHYVINPAFCVIWLVGGAFWYRSDAGWMPALTHYAGLPILLLGGYACVRVVAYLFSPIAT